MLNKYYHIHPQLQPFMNIHAHINIRHSPRPLLRAISAETPVQIGCGRSQQEADFRPKLEEVSESRQGGDAVHVE